MTTATKILIIDIFNLNSEIVAVRFDIIIIISYSMQLYKFLVYVLKLAFSNIKETIRSALS